MPPTSLLRFLRANALCLGGAPLVRALSGGVSSNAYLVRCGNEAFVAKQALRRFRVAKQWRVQPRRLAIEFAFAQLLVDRLGRQSVAPAVAYDPREAWIAVQYVGPPFSDWRRRLLAGKIDPYASRAAGRLLAKIHRIGLRETYLRRIFDQPDLFDEQRIDPYFAEAARSNHEAKPVLDKLADHLRRDRTTLIHGDFSPKNILTDGTRVTLIDHEVATWGDPRFDIAFLLTHLLLKSIRRPSRRREILGLAEKFLQAYGRAEGPAPPDTLTVSLIGALMLARIDGKSPVGYLSAKQRVRAKQTALAVLASPPPDVSELLAAWRPT